MCDVRPVRTPYPPQGLPAAGGVPHTDTTIPRAEPRALSKCRQRTLGGPSFLQTQGQEQDDSWVQFRRA